MKKYIRVCLLVLLGSCNSAFASEWGPWTEVKEIYITTSGAVFVTVNSIPGCYNNQGAYLSGSNVDRAYSTLLAAYMAKKRIRPLYNINSASTGWGMCTITSFFVRD